MATESLRDTLQESFESVIPDAPATTTTETQTAVSGTEQSSAPATKDETRARDDAGRFVEKKESAAPSAKKQEAQTPPPTSASSSAVSAAAVPQAKPRYPRPSTWRKETWGVWDKLNKGEALAPEDVHLMAEEALRRDADFTRGVSTYKQEWDTARPLIEAMAPFMPLLQQHNIAPQQWITNLGNAHRTLAMGSPQEKAQRFAQLAREYGVPLEQLYTLGQDGRLYVNPNLQAAQQQQQTPDIQTLISQELAKRDQQRFDQEAETNVTAFAKQTDKYPHYQEVRDTMAGLLHAGLADGLEDAYEAALRHPRHAALFDSMQQQHSEQEANRKAEEARKAADSARRKAGSPRSGSPTSPAQAGSGKQSLRDTITANAESVLGGRV